MGSHYKQVLKQFNTRLETTNFSKEGDSQFAFLVPEAAFEDSDLLEKMITQEKVTAKFAAALLMVDFTAPTLFHTACSSFKICT